ncbi:hypothetical protein ONZ45_g19570 [Pleurotus djamor]|nr:hypothetical protein ONZ45_g19570 [Pleurotus djamor]
MPSISSASKPVTKSTSALLTPFTPDGLVGEFYTANEYGIEIVPAAGSRGGLFGNGGGASSGSRASSPSSGPSGWSRIFGTRKKGGGYAESYTEETAFQVRVENITSAVVTWSFADASYREEIIEVEYITATLVLSRRSTSVTVVLADVPFAEARNVVFGVCRPFDIVISFLPPPESTYRIGGLPPPAVDAKKKSSRRNDVANTSTREEVVGISEKVLLKQSILVTTLVGPFLVDAILGSGVWMGRLGTAPGYTGGGVPSGRGNANASEGSEGDRREQRRERHQTWTMGVTASGPLDVTNFNAVAGALGLMRPRGRIIHVLPSDPSQSHSKDKKRMEKSKLASGLEQFLVEYGVGKGIVGCNINTQPLRPIFVVSG